MIGGSYAVYKLTQHDIDKIEQETGKSAENITEDELKTAMKNLGIQKMELTADDAIHIERIAHEAEPDIQKFCIYCGDQLVPSAKFCPSCGQKI
jgi:hypothetical protein